MRFMHTVQNTLNCGDAIHCIRTVAERPQMCSDRVSRAFNGTAVMLAVIAFSSAVCEGADLDLRLSLTKDVLSTDETVEARGSAAVPTDQAVIGMTYRASRVGMYHRRLGRFALLNNYPGSYDVSIPTVMPGLPDGMTSPHGIPLEPLGRSRSGFITSFSILEPGIYVIHAEWRIKNLGDGRQQTATRTIASNPVLVFVRPSSHYDRSAEQRSKRGVPGDLGGLLLQEALERYYDERKDGNRRNTLIADPGKQE